MRQGFPIATRGMTVGLLGGSFDPAHEGHVHITHEALRRFGLDRIWWLVSPGNPLKPRPPAPLPQRLVHARRLMRHPRVLVTDLEARLNTRATADTLRALQRIYPGVRFVWIMGADNLCSSTAGIAGKRSWIRCRWACWRGPAGASRGALAAQHGSMPRPGRPKGPRADLAISRRPPGFWPMCR